jgi:hypothetical protein
MAEFKPTFKVKIPKNLESDVAQDIADEIVQFIIDRSQNGFDKNNKKFKKYSLKYAKNKGVGRSEVDLTMSEDMLEEMKVIAIRDGEIEIGYEDDADVIGQVEGNVLGTYGQKEPVVKGGRNFLGIAKEDLATIIGAYVDAD